jgi:hypothetical protein
MIMHDEKIHLGYWMFYAMGVLPHCL